MKKLFFILTVFFLLVQCSNSDTRDSARGVRPKVSQQDPNRPTTILLVGHDLDSAPKTHTYIPTLSDLSVCLKAMDGVKAYVVNGWPSPQMLEMADALVLYGSPGAEICMDSGRDAGFKKALDRGMGFMAIHWSTAVNARNEARLGTDWMAALGGYWVHHSGVELLRRRSNQVDKNHPICNGWSSIALDDEFYLKPKIGPNAKVLLETQINDETLPVAWTTERANKGRSFATTLGHFEINFRDKSFRKFILNSILWVAKKEIPKGGAGC